MNDKIDSIIYDIDKAGDMFLEDYLVPYLKSGANIILNDTPYKYFLEIKTAFIENKISLFIKYLSAYDKEELLKYITSFGKKEKNIFIETINKVIDMDDNLQIYILAFLTKKYQTNEKLNYYETQLFYNINTISEYDFTLYFCAYKKVSKGTSRNIRINSNAINEITEVSLSKFAKLGLLIMVENNITHSSKVVINNHYYKESDYSYNLYKCLELYFINDECSDLAIDDD